ncbi:MAG: hypothetical protein AMQ22_02073 [Candidatus Methanofastidiosum methylothiophilum]|uniref:Uncharacterized protein n=1 Tax=Candidatus Methanofastidiosum methylothiophilum TaxID=1705564 RepID=A0A150INY3_9EURY|nr:MAG: hypothetical protein AMQ22_02073 [Candidatus Methanofastidiosum methylthiophilus]
MYFYMISEGEYDEYVEEILMHTKKFTLDEFKKIINDFTKGYGYQRRNIYVIMEELIENHGFKSVDPIYTCDITSNGNLEFFD